MVDDKLKAHTDDKVELRAFSRNYEGNEAKWTVHLGVHPQVVVRNNGCSSYVHLEKGQLVCNEKIPWGVDAMVTIGIHITNAGGNWLSKYSIMASDGTYLKYNGDLVKECGDDCKFILVIRGDEVAFKAKNGNYLQAGSSGVWKALKNEITKNELFQFEDSYPQVTLSQGGKYWTYKQGTDVKAIHEAVITDKEIFQMEIDRNEDTEKVFNARWSFRNAWGAYLTLNENNLFTSEKQVRDDNSWFFVEWVDSQIRLKAKNGKYLHREANGSIKANKDEPNDNCLFVLNLNNRPRLVIRSEFGNCGVKKVQGKDLIQCAQGLPDVFEVFVKDGKVKFKSSTGFWKLESDGSISATGSSAGDADDFHFVLAKHTFFAIKSSATGKYLKAEQSGAFKAASNAISDLELWEY